MKIRKTLLLLACLGGSTLLAQTPPPILFQDDFETAEPDGTPSIAIWGESDIPRDTEHQWVRVTNEDSETYFGEADNNYLHFYSDGDSSTGSNWISAQNNQFDGSSVISVHFDFHRAASTSAGNNDPKLRFGIGNPIFGNSASRYTVYFQNNAISGQPVIQNGQAHHFQVVYNNTKEPVTYLDGQAVLKADSYDVWIDGERVMTNVKFAYNTSSAPVQIEESLTSIGIGVWGSADADFRMDNLVIYDGAYAVGNPPPPDPVIEDQVIFADDFSEFTAQAEPNEMLSQPLLETWKRNPTTVAYPDNIIDVTAENSELYFGEADNNYLRFFKKLGAPGNLHLTTNSGFEHPSELITISFDFYEPAGIGETNSPLEVLPGISTVGNSQRVHKLTLANGSISGIGNLYEEGTVNNIQVVFNNSHHAVSYLDGAVTVASDSFDVWLNGRRVLSSYDYGRGGLGVGIPLTSAQFIIWAHSNGTREQEMFLDNLQVYNYPHVENPDLTVRPGFADDFSEPVDGTLDADHWGSGIANASPPNRVIEVTDADSETYFGEPGNNYMRIFHDGTANANLNTIAHNRFNSEIITIAFDFFEPAGFGESNFVLRPGVGNAPNGSRIHEITFNNGNLSGVDDVYLEGVQNRIEIVMNNSAEHHTYLDGELTLASNTYDVWLNGELVLHNHTYNHGGTYPVGSPLTSLQFAIWNGNSNEFLIDNLEIFEQAHVPNVDGPIILPPAPPIFADDFTQHENGAADPAIWQTYAQGEWEPHLTSRVVNTDADVYFGEAENNYLRIYSDGEGSWALNQTALNAFTEPSPVITIAFDFFEPADFGDSPLTLRTGIHGMANASQRIHEVTFSNGTLASTADAYEEGVMNNIQIVMNNDTEPAAYHQPGIAKTVAPDTFDVWINGELVLADHQNGRGSLALGTALSSLQFMIPPSNSNEFLIDNLQVFGYATARTEAVSDGITFAEWAAANLPEGLRGPEDDAAGDGIPNLVKFALGLDPLTPSRDGLPRTEIVSDNGETRLAITGQLFLDAADVNVEVQFSSDLVNWERLEGPLEVIEMVSENIAIIRVIDTETIDGTSRRFLRLNVTQN